MKYICFSGRVWIQTCRVLAGWVSAWRMYRTHSVSPQYLPEQANSYKMQHGIGNKSNSDAGKGLQSFLLISILCYRKITQ